jgi:hypothetical protein
MEESPLISKIRSWYLFAKRAWIALIIGWLFVPIGFTTLIGLDQAGALLICGVLVAEILNKKGHRLFIEQVIPGRATSFIYKEIQRPEHDFGEIEITQHVLNTGKTIVNSDQWTLYQLANDSEFRAFEDTRIWDLDRTLKRVENTVEYSLVFSAIIGTILWAFAGVATA